MEFKILQKLYQNLGLEAQNLLSLSSRKIQSNADLFNPDQNSTFEDVRLILDMMEKLRSFISQLYDRFYGFVSRDINEFNLIEEYLKDVEVMIEKNYASNKISTQVIFSTRVDYKIGKNRNLNFSDTDIQRNRKEFVTNLIRKLASQLKTNN